MKYVKFLSQFFFCLFLFFSILPLRWLLELQVVAGTSGGTLYIVNSNRLQILNSNFNNNAATNMGSINIESSTNINIFNSNFTGNIAINEKQSQEESTSYYFNINYFYNLDDDSGEVKYFLFSFNYFFNYKIIFFLIIRHLKVLMVTIVIYIFFSDSDNINIVSCLIKQHKAASYGSISFNSNNYNINIKSSIIEGNIASQGISAG
jgi:hypothetical protein